MDKKPGDRTGDGRNTVWRSVQPHWRETRSRELVQPTM
ncbi:hypothetical protein [Caballeronia sp. RCC_10]